MISHKDKIQYKQAPNGSKKCNFLEGDRSLRSGTRNEGCVMRVVIKIFLLLHCILIKRQAPT